MTTKDNGSKTQCQRLTVAFVFVQHRFSVYDNGQHADSEICAACDCLANQNPTVITFHGFFFSFFYDSYRTGLLFSACRASVTLFLAVQEQIMDLSATFKTVPSDEPIKAALFRFRWDERTSSQCRKWIAD